MRLTAGHFTTFLNPSKCDRRVFFRSRGEAEEPPSAYQEVLLRLGERHEHQHLATLGPVADLSQISMDERFVETERAMAARAPVIYQGAFRYNTTLSGQSCEIVGIPDFLLADSGRYVIRDSKIARRITEEDHPEILRQLEIYGWLYERSSGHPPVRLQVHSGPGALVDLPYDGGTGALAVLEKVVSVTQSNSEPYDPVGWSKCKPCCFGERCIQSAKDRRDIAYVDGIDQGLTMALRQIGVETIDELLDRFNVSSLAEFTRPWGNGMRRVGNAASSILDMANAMYTGKEKILNTPNLPRVRNYVMFDLEGLPPQLDELDKIYLWGTQVFGENKGAFLPAVASFGSNGDEEGWKAFLSNAASIFQKHGDIPFVHWHHYERTKLDGYVNRYGDPNGIAARVRSNLLDLLPITRKSIALPLPSYSLKVIEKYIGFKRSLDEYGGD